MTQCNGFEPVMHARMDCFQVSGHSELYSEVELHGLHDGQVDLCRQLMQMALKKLQHKVVRPNPKP